MESGQVLIEPISSDKDNFWKSDSLKIEIDSISDWDSDSSDTRDVKSNFNIFNATKKSSFYIEKSTVKYCKAML